MHFFLLLFNSKTSFEFRFLLLTQHVSIFIHGVGKSKNIIQFLGKSLLFYFIGFNWFRCLFMLPVTIFYDVYHFINATYNFTLFPTFYILKKTLSPALKDFIVDFVPCQLFIFFFLQVIIFQTLI